ncbi:MAG: DEAD/DEAH box helicase [Brumimicrobium sp.]|nr:DEAD/DEAH box helicase [Brumimicrobium sp.]
MEFTQLHLESELLNAIDYMGYKELTPIQEYAIPEILAGKDIIGCAQTGTGKTVAFVLPILNYLSQNPTDDINTLIIVPTRELAIQIEQQIQGLAYFVSVSSTVIYGGGDGKDWQIQKDALVGGTNIIVATPGKLISHLKLGYVDFSSLKHLVLDEADRMLDMGFIDDLTTIINKLPKNRQTLLFSATMAPEIRKLAKNLLTDPIEINLSLSKPAEGVKQSVYLCFDEQKNKTLEHILNERKHYQKIIIFTSTKDKVVEITRFMRTIQPSTKGISSNLEQEEREEVLRGFRSGRVPVLVATDVMSRGIDIQDIDLVINYDVPGDAEEYVHRVGRTARANTKGEAISLINPKDMARLARIQKLIEMEIPVTPLPVELGEAPIWEVKEKTKNKKFYGKKKWNKNKHFSKGGETGK